MIQNPLYNPIVGFVTTDKIEILNLEVRIEWHRGQFENSDKDSRDPSNAYSLIYYTYILK